MRKRKGPREHQCAPASLTNHTPDLAPWLPTFTAGKTRPKPLRLNLPSDLRYNVSTLVPERVLRHRSTPLKPSGVTNYHGPIRLTAGRAFSCYGVSWVSFDPVESRNIGSHITSSLLYLFFIYSVFLSALFILTLATFI